MISIKVPPLGESIVEATVSRWMRAAGDSVSAGDTLVELETDKITVEVPAPSAGTLARQLAAEGDVVKVDQPLCELDETATAAGASVATPGAQASAVTTTATAATAATPAAADEAATAAVRASPAAARLAAESGVDLAAIQGTGRGGVVSKPDVVEQARRTPSTTPPPGPTPSAAAASATPAPARATPASGGNGTRETREKMSTRRRRIAENLLHAQQATAHLTTFNEVDMSAVEALRTRFRERVEKEHGVRLSFMPFFVKAACMALETYPVVNAQVDGDSIVYKHYVNMGIAVATEAGLVVPSVKDAHAKGIIQIAREIADLARRGRDGKLTMDDLTGGTFTITNGGVFGSLVSTPIINYPQSAILGLHKIQDRPVVVNGQIAIRPMMYVALSYDHRIIDGQQAVLFLVRVKELMEDPAAMVIQ